jgi:hypothetical protein
VKIGAKYDVNHSDNYYGVPIVGLSVAGQTQIRTYGRLIDIIIILIIKIIMSNSPVNRIHPGTGELLFLWS